MLGFESDTTSSSENDSERKNENIPDVDELLQALVLLLVAMQLLELIDMLSDDNDSRLFEIGPGRGNGPRAPRYRFESENQYEKSVFWL